MSLGLGFAAFGLALHRSRRTPVNLPSKCSIAFLLLYNLLGEFLGYRSRTRYSLPPNQRGRPHLIPRKGPFPCGQVYLWYIYCNGCIWCLVGVKCLQAVQR